MSIRFTDIETVRERVKEVVWAYTHSDDIYKAKKLEQKLHEDFINYIASGGCVLISSKAKEVARLQSTVRL